MPTPNCCRSTPERRRSTRRLLSLVVVGVALIAGVAVTGAVIPAAPLAVDRSWSQWMRDLDSGVLRQVALAFNALGRGVLRAATILLVAGGLAALRRWRGLIALAALEALTPACVTALKGAVDRPRPPHELVHAVGSSYPSGHAAYAGATSVAVVLLLTGSRGRPMLRWSLAGVFTAGMAWSRTYLQVHWLTDAVAGALLGIGVALVCIGAVELARRRG